MWVDGGTRRHLFITQPPPEAMGGTTRRLYSIVHGDLSAGEEKVRNGVLQIAERTSALLNDESLKDSIRLQEDFASQCPAGVQCGPGGRLFESRYASGARAATACAPKLEECSKADVSGGDTYCKAYLGCLADGGYEDGKAYAKGTRDWLSAKDLCLRTDPNCGQNMNARRRPYQ